MPIACRIKNDAGPTIVIVGLGQSSIGVARAATRLGLYVIGLDRNPNAAGARHVDKQLLQSTHDQLVDSQLHDTEVRGVICSSSDLPAFRTAAAIAQALDVAGPAADVDAFDDKFALAQTLGDLAPQTALERASIYSNRIWEKPRFGQGLHFTKPMAHDSVFQEQVDGEEFFVGGVARQDISEPSIILRKRVFRTRKRQVHSYAGRVQESKLGINLQLASGSNLVDAALSGVWSAAKERLSAGHIFLGMDCIIHSDSRVPYVIDSGPSWDLGLGHLLPIVGVDVQQQLVASFLSECVGFAHSIKSHINSEVQLGATAEILEGVPTLTSLSVLRQSMP